MCLGQLLKGPVAFENKRSGGVAHEIGGQQVASIPFLWDPVNGLRDLNLLAFDHVPAAGETRITRAYAIKLGLDCRVRIIREC